MNQSKTQTEITKEDIKDISEETGLKEEYIEDSVEKQKADEIFEQSKKEVQRDTEDRNLKQKFINTVKFIGRSFYMRATDPIFGTITEINTSGSSNKIILELQVEYPDIADGEESKKSVFKSKTSKELVFDMDYQKNVEKIQKLLDINNVSKPSKLENCKIPIRSTTSELDYGMSAFNFYEDIPHSNMTLKQKTGRFIQRTLVHLNCFERASSYHGTKKHGEFKLNKNIFLYLSIATFIPQLFTGWFILTAFYSTFIGLYIYLVIINILYGLSDIFNNNQGERYYIKQKLKK